GRPWGRFVRTLDRPWCVSGMASHRTGPPRGPSASLHHGGMANVTVDSFHALTRHLRRPAFLLDIEGRILALHPSARALLDMSSDSDGTFLSEHLANDDEHVSGALRTWISSGTFAGRELAFLRVGGKPIPYRAEGMRI